MVAARWDLSSLLNAADAAAPAVERHLWLIHLLEWLRSSQPLSETEEGERKTAGTPWPVRRLRHLLNVLDRHPEHQTRVAALLHKTLLELDATGLLADYGFSPRQGFLSELGERLRLACLPGTPQTGDFGSLFHLLFWHSGDAAWISAIDDRTLSRWLRLCCLGGSPPAAPDRGWQNAMMESIQLLASQMRASGLSAAMRQRMEPALLTDRPFHQVVQAAETLRELWLAEPGLGSNAVADMAADVAADLAADVAPDAVAGRVPADAALLQQAHYLRAVLAACGEASASVRSHLDEYGISVDLVFQIDQMRARSERIEALLGCVLAADPVPDLRQLAVDLVRIGAERRAITALFTQHYGLLARKVTERSAETGEHYITRDHAEYREMLVKAGGGGAVIGVTTLLKVGVVALALPVFWAGFWAGMNYALSFVVVHLLHWTVATKQPAMTAPSLAAKLEGVAASDQALQGFVDEVAHLLRSQIAGILGNLALVVPVVLAAQGLAWWLSGAPLIGVKEAHYVLHSLTLLGPTAFYAAFTGVLLFASSLIAGWVENWFVFHRLDSAIAWNPRFRARLGATRAQAWARWWRANISGLAANVSLGLLLGLVPALASFFGLPLEVRHVTLATGQIAAALGALGTTVLREPDFWWCMAAIPAIGMLNLGVSFWLAFRVAVVSRGLKLRDRGRVYQALRERLRSAPLSFFWPPGAGS